MSEQSQLAKADRIENRIEKTIAAQTGLTETGAMAFQSVEQIMNFAKVMAIAGVAVPKHLRENVGACLAIAIQASEWQMSPFAVASKTYVVNDRVGFEAQLVAAVILRRAPIQGRIRYSYSGEGQKRRCKAMATLKEGGDVEYESPELGTIPVKNSPLWKGDPDQQLAYYSVRAMCRRHFPDVILGVYTPEELDEAVPIQAEVMQPIPQGRLASQPATVTEMAAQERAAEKPVAPTPEPEEKPAAEEKPSEPAPPEEDDDAKERRALVRSLLAKGREINAGKGKIMDTLFEMKLIEEGVELESLSPSALTDIHDAWTEIKDQILNPGASA